MKILLMNASSKLRFPSLNQQLEPLHTYPVRIVEQYVQVQIQP
ncbi:hypothetical protein [Gloeocapsopsis sp. IPPAS B-1203]|nr:hypothetical protein [Gloeocapsopsis sp. IPPAS B-1203]